MRPDFARLLEFIDKSDPNLLVGEIVKAVIAAWEDVDVEDTLIEMAKRREELLTKLLERSIRALPMFRDLPFRVTVEHQERDASDPEETVRYDLSFAPYNAHQADGKFVVFECKILRDWDGSQCKSKNSEYVDGKSQGMTAFTSGRYAVTMNFAGMIGYVCCDCGEDPLKSLGDLIRQHAVLLMMRPGTGLVPHNDFAEGLVWTTEHDISRQATRMFHVFLTKHRRAPAETSSSGQKKPKRKAVEVGS